MDANGKPDGAGNITIAAKTVDIVEARETSTSSTEQKFSQSGISVGLSNPVVSALQTAGNTVQSMADASGKTSDSRMQALAAASTALAAKGAVSDVQKLSADPKEAGSVGIAISIGSSQSQSNSASNTDSARGSSVQGAGDVNISASGGGKDSNFTVQGGTVDAGKAVTLNADSQVNLLAAANSTTQTSSNSSSSNSLGASFSLGAKTGYGIGFSASNASGQGNGADAGYTNTQVTGNTVAIQSGGDTTLKGAVVKGSTVDADVGGNLVITSLQDKSTYAESSQNSNASVSIGVGTASGASLSTGSSKINSNFQRVQEQSGIHAGDGAAVTPPKNGLPWAGRGFEACPSW